MSALPEPTSPNGQKAGHSEALPGPGNIFCSICVDFSEMPTVKVEGSIYDYKMVIVCRLSSYTMAIPTRKKGLNAERAANLFVKNCVHILRLPSEILTDVDHVH